MIREMLLAGIIVSATAVGATLASPSAWPVPLVGDGVHDDGPALAAALAGNLVVELPPGTFLVSRTLVLRAGTQLRGAGTGVTILRLAPGSNRNLMETERFSELTGGARL